MGRPERFAIIGGGIGGLTLAIAMQKKRFNVTVYEHAPSLKPLGAGLGLGANAIKAFAEIGIGDHIMKAGSVLKKIRIKDQKGNTLAETDSERISAKYNVVDNFTIHRADLHQVLLQQLADDTLQLGKGCVDFIQTKSGVKLIFQDGSSSEADYVIACDGVHSVFRKKLIPESLPRYAGYTCWRAVVNDPPVVDLTETSETWGAGHRFGIVPVSKGRLYWFACINSPENNARMRAYGIKELLEHFGKFHSPIPEIIQHTKDDQLIWNDIIDIKPLRQFAFGNIVLMGDAAHATTPNMGQGACMAIEDAAILSNVLATGITVEDAFLAFEQRRIKRTASIVNKSRQLGQIAQWENPMLIGIRNLLLRLTPPSVAEKQAKFLIDVNLH
jgi:2-polyprenyl-6-methoxyphenol hydroxylase-like FAD-dependent oxidoreductase